MASVLKVDKLDPQSGTALEIGTSGDTVTVPTGAGLTVTDEVKTNKISPATGTAFALGDSGDTFTVPSGATIVNSGTATGFGTSEYDVWRVTTNFSGSADPIASNWERDDTSANDYASDKIGTGMTESSGIWTFPATGYYEVVFIQSRYSATASADDYNVIITASNNAGDGDDYTAISETNGGQDGNFDGQAIVRAFIKVSSTTTSKIKIGVANAASQVGTQCDNGNNTNMTYASFMKVGDL